MGYLELGGAGGGLFIEEASMDALAKVDTIVFDCDGVLLDVRESYNACVGATVSRLVEALTGTHISPDLFDGRLNHLYKSTGGFNSDWSYCYALVMAILSKAPERALRELDRYAAESLGLPGPCERLRHLTHRVEASIPLAGLYAWLASFSSRLDASGVEGVDRLTKRRVGEHLAEALNPLNGVGVSVVSTLFEELFLGCQLFREVHGREACFTDQPQGYVRRGRRVITEETLDGLEGLLGGPRFGVASGSMEATASLLLGPLKSRIPLEAQFWFETVERWERRLGLEGLQKPNGFSLRAAASTHKPAAPLYVGDTVADLLTARDAGEDFLFAGVYGLAHLPHEARGFFMGEGCPVVARSVNQLPHALRYARFASE